MAIPPSLAARAKVSHVRAKILRACLASGMPHERARAAAERAASNYSVARTRLGLTGGPIEERIMLPEGAQQEEAESDSEPLSSDSSAGGGAISCCVPLRQRGGGVEQSTADALPVISSTPPALAPLAGDEFHCDAALPARQPRGMAGLSVEERMRRDFQSLAPYIERVNEIGSACAALSHTAQRSYPSPPTISLEFGAPCVEAGEKVSTCLVIIDGHAFFQRSHEDGHDERVSDIYSFASDNEVIAVARALRGPFRAVWKAMQLEAIIRSNMQAAGNEFYFAASA